MYDRLFIRQYANKYIIDHQEISKEKLTYKYLKYYFKDCAIPVRDDMLHQIKEQIVLRLLPVDKLTIKQIFDANRIGEAAMLIMSKRN
jgi:hypothetical protein